MARIRTIKPDFWSDEKLVECSTNARLLFIGSWNFADDNGNLVRSSKKLKMQVFPGDHFDCETLINELIEQGLFLEYVVNGEKYLHIKGFDKHQRIDKPQKSNIPVPKFAEHSTNAPRMLSEPSGTEGKGKEGKGKEGNKKEDTPLPPSIFEASVLFEEFWLAYPRKLGRGAALPEYREALTRITHESLMQALLAYQFDPDPNLIPAPARWLKEDRWLDRPVAKKQTFADMGIY